MTATVTIESATSHEPHFGPTGREVYNRTYSRRVEGGGREEWRDTVARVVDGNLNFVDSKYWEPTEREKLIELMYDFKILPAGRHLWATGVPGRQFIMNCWHSGWTNDISEHFYFTFDQLMQGGGVGSNYSTQYLEQYPDIASGAEVFVVSRKDHEDIEEMNDLLDGYNNGAYGDAKVYVLPDTREGWANALVETFNAFYGGYKLVLDVSNIRPRGAEIKGFGGTASGPSPLVAMINKVSNLLHERVGEKLRSLDAMLIDHWIGECVVSGNVRRSARMSIKNWMDDDIFEFIHCKQDTGQHWSTNISVEIDNDFFDAINQGDEHARKVYRECLTGMLKNGEPGFYNRSLAQEGEHGEVSSTNPCGEITLEAFEYCCLGHVNLDAFYDDFDGALEAHRLMARFLLRATFADIPDAKSREVGERNRRIGVGHLGFQGWLVKQGIKYSESHKSGLIKSRLRNFYKAVRAAADAYADSMGINRPVKVATAAPTGSIAKMPGVTEGIHPVLFKYFINNIRFSTSDAAQAQSIQEFIAKGLKVEDDIYTSNTKVVSFVAKNSLLDQVAELGFNADAIVEEAAEISFEDMLAVQAMYQENYADNAVSFTINLPGQVNEDGTTTPNLPFNEAEDILIKYLPKVKGTTIMVDGTRPQAPYIRLTKDEFMIMSEGTFVESTDAIDMDCATGACPIK